MDTDHEGEIMTLLKYDENPSNSNFIASGHDYLVSELEKVVPLHGEVTIRGVGFLDVPQIFPFDVTLIRLITLRISESDLGDTSKYDRAVDALVEILHVPKSHLVLPRAWYEQRLELPMTILHRFKRFTGKAKVKGSDWTAPIRDLHSPFSSNADSVMFTSVNTEQLLGVTFVGIGNLLVKPQLRGVIWSPDGLSLHIRAEEANGGMAERVVGDANDLMRLLGPASTVVLIMDRAPRITGGIDEGGCLHHSPEILSEGRWTPPCARGGWRSRFWITVPWEGVPKTLDIYLSNATGPYRILTGNFSSIATLKCTPYLLLPFLSKNLLPSLHTIELKWPSCVDVEAELRYFDNLIVNWFCDHTTPFPSLRTLGISWFPDWSRFVHVVKAIAEASGGKEVTLKFPALPGLDILEFIASNLGLRTGVRAILLAGVIMFTRPSFSANSRGEGPAPTKKDQPCYFCRCSSLSCTFNYSGGVPHCDLHSRTKLVTFKPFALYSKI